VAAFFAVTVLIIGLSAGTLSTVVEEGVVAGKSTETGKSIAPWLDAVFVPIFRGVLKIVTLVQQFSPIDSLSSGRSITWAQLGLAFAQIVLLIGGIFAAIGMFIFNRRELAKAQVNA